MKRNRILNSGIMGIKGDNIIYSHTDQLLKAQSTVQRFSPGSFVLTAFVKEGHNDIDPSGFPSYGGNDPLQILKVIVRGHMVGVAAQRISQGIVADIHHEVKIVAPDGFLQDTLCLAGTETRGLRIDQIRRALISLKLQVVFFLMVTVLPPFHDVVVDFCPKPFAAFQGNDAKTAYRK